MPAGRLSLGEGADTPGAVLNTFEAHSTAVSAVALVGGELLSGSAGGWTARWRLASAPRMEGDLES